jgi:hypothetical protein
MDKTEPACKKRYSMSLIDPMKYIENLGRYKRYIQEGMKARSKEKGTKVSTSFITAHA